MIGRDVAIIFLSNFYHFYTWRHSFIKFYLKKKISKKSLLLDIDILWKLIRTLWFNPLECQKDWKIGVAFCSHVVGYKHLVDYCSFAFNHLPKNRGSSHFMPILWKIYICSLCLKRQTLIFFFFVKIVWKKLRTTPRCLQWFIFTYKWFWNGKFQTLQLATEKFPSAEFCIF